MPEPKLSRLAATVFCNPDQLPLQPSRRRNRKRTHKRTKRYHRVFRLPIALGLYPTKQRQCDPFGLRLSTMHIMESECEKSGGILTAEGAPEIGTKANGVVIAEEALENGSGVLSPENKTISEEPPGQEEPGGTEEEQEELGGTEDVLDEPVNVEPECSDDVEGIDEVGAEELEEMDGIEEADVIEETEALEEADVEEETVAEADLIEESDTIGIEEADALNEPIEDSEAIEDSAMEDAEGIEEEPAGDLEANESLKEINEVERIEADGLESLEEANDLNEADLEALDEVPEAESAEPASIEVPVPEPSQPEPSETNKQVPSIRPEPDEKMDVVPTIEEISNVPQVSDVRETPSVSPTPSLPKENGISSPTTSPKLSSTPKEEKDDSEEEEKPRIITKLPEVQIEKVRKRSLDGEASSSSESDSTKKRLRHQEPTTTPSHQQDHPSHGEDERESSIQKFIESCAQSIEEINMASEKLQKEMSALSELAKAKEIEWNSILRLRKLKEEMFERLQRKKREVQVLEGKFSDEFYHHNPFVNQMVLQMQRQNKELSPDSTSITNPWGGMGNMMGLQVNPMLARIPDLSKQQRPILPKPFHPAMDHSSMREGRNGPILDVKSIIADYRSRHGGEAPPGRQRGRRRGLMPGQMEGHPQGGPGPGMPPRHVSSSPSLISMANMALGTAFSVRTYDPPPPPYPPLPMGVQERVGGDHNNHGANNNPGATSFKEALVQFAKLGPGGGRGAGNYPEVTLHPVGSAGMGQPLHPPTSTSGHNPHHINQQPPHPSNQSLLHGILTKTPVAAHTKQAPTTFSPTLARLLTAPDQHHGRQHLAHPQQQHPHHGQPTPHPNPHSNPQPAHQNSYHHRPNPVNINEILASKKSRTDITITPVSSSNNAAPKPKEEVVLLQDEDEEGSTGDRLVIDEGPDGNNQEEVPQCQGCRQKPAQFVCAGCGNQWYCSRECQVTAWEEHSDVCSG